MSTSKPRSREPLNTRQRTILTEFYDQNPYPSARERLQLTQITGRTLKQIQDWFSNRRRNDTKLVSDTSTYPPLPPPPPVPIQPIYYYTPTATICPCCCFAQTSSMIDQSLYPPYTTLYYPPPNSFHS